MISPPFLTVEMPEAHADGYDQGEEDALVQGSTVLSLMLDVSFSLLLSLLLLMTISILQDSQCKCLFTQKDVCTPMCICFATPRRGLWCLWYV